MQVPVPEVTISDRVEIDPARTALLIVDMQNDFVRLDGKLPVPDAAGTIPAIKRLRTFAREHGLPVFYTQDSHEAGDPEFAIWGEHARICSDGWRIVEELAPNSLAGDIVVRKGRYDGFFETDLDKRLRAAGVSTLIVCGTVANVCVLHTAASAALRWYHVVLPADATSALHPFDLQVTFRQVAFLYHGTITRSDALVAAG